MYLNIGVSVLLNAIGLSKERVIATQELNVFRALLKVFNGYECARLKGNDVKYLFPSHSKLATLTGYSPQKVGRCLSTLRKSQLLISKTHLEFNQELLPSAYSVKEILGQNDPKRLAAIPVSFFSKDFVSTKGTILSFLGFAIRCCWQDRGELKKRGRVAVSSLVEATGLSKSTIKSSIKRLATIFTLSEGDKWWIINKHGRSFDVDYQEEQEVETQEIDPISDPSEAQIDPISDPLIRKENSSTKRSKYQRTISGVSLRDIKREDLEKPKRLYQLFKQARKAGLTSESESSKLQFVALAQHALRVGRDAVRLFSSNLRNRRYETISGIDEDRARKLITQGRAQVRGLRSKIEMERLPEPVVSVSGAPELRDALMASLAEAEAYESALK